MFLEILQTLIKVLLVFSILIIAFGLAFYIVLSNSAKTNVSRSVHMASTLNRNDSIAECSTIWKPFVLLDNSDELDPNVFDDVGRNGLCRHLRSAILLQ